MTRQTKIAYVQAAWHTDITDRCKQAFVAELARHGYDQSGIEFFSAPGSLEIPLMAKKLARTGRYAAVCASRAITFTSTPSMRSSSRSTCGPRATS